MSGPWTILLIFALTYESMYRKEQHTMVSSSLENKKRGPGNKLT